ncbi:hypothetical protein [Streptomyces sp. NPDC056682]|uniref:hypothetical protein n=1 Tax=Streptomyces sp. NPDC056682 TaxID=3345909 RepID=UPI0036D1BCF7
MSCHADICCAGLPWSSVICESAEPPAAAVLAVTGEHAMTTATSLRRTPSAPAIVGYVRAAAGKSPVPQINTLMRVGVAEEDIYIERTNGHKTAWPGGMSVHATASHKPVPRRRCPLWARLRPMRSDSPSAPARKVQPSTAP